VVFATTTFFSHLINEDNRPPHLIACLKNLGHLVLTLTIPDIIINNNDSNTNVDSRGSTTTTTISTTTTTAAAIVVVVVVVVRRCGASIPIKWWQDSLKGGEYSSIIMEVSRPVD